MLKELSSRWCINSQETGAHRFALCRLCWNWQAHVAASTNTPPASSTPIDDPRIAAALARSDLALDTLKSEPVTVYLVLPPAKLTANTRFVRLFIGSAPAAISACSEQPAHKVVFFLDEFAQLGRLVAIEDAISLVRGYGALFWIFVQDLSQLKAVYERWNTFLAISDNDKLTVTDIQAVM